RHRLNRLLPRLRVVEVNAQLFRRLFDLQPRQLGDRLEALHLDRRGPPWRPEVKRHRRRVEAESVKLDPHSDYPAMTMFTSCPRATMSFTTFFPLMKAWTFSSARASSRSFSSLVPAGTTSLLRSLPLTCTGTSISSAFTSSGSNFGHGS